MYLILFIICTVIEMLLREYMFVKDANPKEEKRLTELKNKKNKTYDEKLEYIKINEKYKKYISFSPTMLIRLVILISVLSAFPQYRLHIIIGLISIKIIKILLKGKRKILRIIKAFFTYGSLFLFFRVIRIHNIWLVLLIVFILSFVFNLIKNWRKQNVNTKNRKKKN